MHPTIQYCHKNGVCVHESSAFVLSLSFRAADSVAKSDRIPAVQAEAKIIAKNFSFASFLCMLGLASVINITIESYFPIKEEASLSSYETMFNSTILPRNPKYSGAEKVHIFRCAIAPIDFLFNNKIPELKNHYVPLVPIEGLHLDASISSKTVNNSNGPAQIKACTTITVPVSVPRNLPLKMNKRKQRQAIINFPSKIMKTESAIENSDNTSCAIVNPPQLNYPPNEVPIFTLSIPEDAALALTDIGFFYLQAKSFPDNVKYQLLCNIWKPDSTFTFPVNSSGRRFQLKWLSRFPWLVYSNRLDGCFCLHCVLFGGESSHNASKLSQLFTSPLTHWSNAVQRCNDHEIKSPIHLTATLRVSQFRSCMEQRTASISVQADKLVAKQVTINREKLKPIIEAIVLCGRQNISLRGHRDDSQYYDETTNNPGNLQAILSYLARCGNNKLFEDHFASAPKSATYRSKTTQNAIIDICGAMIGERIIEDVHSQKFFAILADEATDVSNAEQLSIVIRYVDSSSEIQERFLEFVHCKDGMSGKAISEKILESLKSHGLDISLCRGQGYDGAGNMAGKIQGVAARIQRDYPQAIYVHCGSHLLNLAVASACKVQEISNMLDHMKAVTDFFSSHPKHFDLLANNIRKYVPSSRHSHLIDVCKTRWIARLDGLDVFVEVFEAIVASLRHVKQNTDHSWARDAVKSAYSLYHGVVAFEFIAPMVIVCRLLGITRPLTKQLQSNNLDAVSAVEKITLLFTMLKRVRNDIDEMHNQWFSEAVQIAQKIETPLHVYRTVDYQMYRCNVPSDSPAEYYKRTISIPFLDHLANQIETRFATKNIKLLFVSFAFPVKVVSDSQWQDKFSMFWSQYIDDLPEPGHLPIELKMWEEYWLMYKGVPPNSLSTLLLVTDKMTFPNIYTSLKIAATIPVTTCECERSIGTMVFLSSCSCPVTAPRWFADVSFFCNLI